MTYSLNIFAVAGPWASSAGPDEHGLADAVEAALALERRFVEGHPSREDLARYRTTCNAIERIGRQSGELIARVSASSFDRLLQRGDSSGRLDATFHPPGLARDWLFAVGDLAGESEFRNYFRGLAENLEREWGVVASYAFDPAIQPALAAAEVSEDTPSLADRETADHLRTTRPKWPAFAGDHRMVKTADAFWAECMAAIEGGEPVVVGASARHAVVAEVIAHLYAQVASQTSLRLMYADGSESRPLPIRPLPAGEKSLAACQLRLGLMSMRHTDLDHSVVGYWFRNRLVSVSRTLAETEEYCFRTTITQLEELTAAGISSIEIVQTGFEPAVVGFYRAVASWLAGRPDRPLFVQPVFLTRDGNKRGLSWPAMSGAK